MEYRRLGDAGLKVSSIGLGSWLTYGTVTERDRARECVEVAWEAGVNHFDCANMYGSEPHAAEAFLGQALSSYPRAQYVLTTKAYWPVGPGPNDRGLSRKHLFVELEKSLQALKTDYVDIFYCHRADPETDLEETMRALDDMVAQGKVLYTGISEWPSQTIKQAMTIQDEFRLRKLRASQPAYNLLNRSIEDEVLPLCQAHGIGTIAFSPLAQGILTGKYRSGEPWPKDSRASNPAVGRSIQRFLTPKALQQAQQLQHLADAHGLSLTHMALAWILQQPGISGLIIGASRPQQVRDNLEALNVNLSSELLAQIDRITRV